MTRYRINPACAFLVKAFAPAAGASLRDWSHKAVSGNTERLSLSFDLKDAAQRKRAGALVASAQSYVKVSIGRHVVREISAAIARDDVLSVDVTLVREKLQTGGTHHASA